MGCRLLRPYLSGLPFTIQTDYNAPQLILNLTDVTGILARWYQGLPVIEFRIVHRVGIKHQKTDELSRPTTAGMVQPLLKDEMYQY